MPASCAFCGFTGKLTGEHVFGDWLRRIGLDLDPVAHLAGPLNRIGRDLGLTPPFIRTVRGGLQLHESEQAAGMWMRRCVKEPFGMSRIRVAKGGRLVSNSGRRSRRLVLRPGASVEGA